MCVDQRQMYLDDILCDNLCGSLPRKSIDASLLEVGDLITMNEGLVCASCLVDHTDLSCSNNNASVSEYMSMFLLQQRRLYRWLALSAVLPDEIVDLPPRATREEHGSESTGQCFAMTLWCVEKLWLI